MVLPVTLGKDANPASEFGHPARREAQLLTINSHPLMAKRCSWLLQVKKPPGREPQGVAVFENSRGLGHHS